jgi:hypothetical protein
MFDWHKLTQESKENFLAEASAKSGYPTQIIEKDFWVTVALKAIFDTPWVEALVFKGGTSLSKAWNLIDRFSEDIDLAIDRTALGFSAGDISKSQIKKLRETSARFMEAEFMPDLEQRLLENGIEQIQFQLEIEPITSDDVDPRIIKLRYNSIVPGNEYVRDQVLIEIGARSLREPCTQRNIQSILSALFPNSPVEDPIFTVETVLPERTFLEKAMLLHEEHCKDIKHRRHLRLSRHLYDLHRIKSSPHAASALADKNLFDTIVSHRRLFNSLRGISYDHHNYDEINFIPPPEVIDNWRQDYEQMGIMIFGQRPSFNEIMDDMNNLLIMFRESGSGPAHYQISK